MVSLAFPPVDLGWFALIGLIPLFDLASRAKPWRAALAGFSFGVTFFGAVLYWIRLFGPEAYGALVLLMSLNVAVFMVLVSLTVRDGRPLLNAVVMAAVWTVGEWVRGAFPFGGFTWGDLAYSQTFNPASLKLAAFTGAWGITFAAALVNGLLLALIRATNNHQRVAWLAGVAAVLALPGLLPSADPQGDTATVAIVQGNAPEGTFDPSSDDWEVLNSHARITADLGRDVDLVVWPEQAVGRDPFATPAYGEVISNAARTAGAPILAGTDIDFPDRKFRNTTAFWNADGEMVGEYAKRHLVPFGEYFPGRGTLEPLLAPYIQELAMLTRDGIPGEEVIVFEIPQGIFGSVICYESTFPGLVRDFVNEGARLLVVSTNNSSYDRTAASDQHLEFSQVRAAEHRMWVAHAALTGISGVVGPSGKILEKTELFTEALLVNEMVFSHERTFYAKWGDWFVLMLALGVFPTLWGSFFGRRRPARPRPSDGEVNPLIIIPTYEEAANIEGLLAEIKEAEPRASILVVDDASPDGTAELVSKAAERDEAIHLMSRPSKMGLGRAYRDGFRWGLERTFTHMIEIDADFSHNPAQIPMLIEATDDCHVAIGTRYIDGGGVVGWSLPRLLLSKAGNRYARFWLGFDVADSTSGFRCYRREVLESIDLDSLTSEGYAFQIDMTARAIRGGFRVTEVPITFSERRAGGSKMNKDIILEALAAVPIWGVKELFQARRAYPEATGSTESRERART